MNKLKETFSNLEVVDIDTLSAHTYVPERIYYKKFKPNKNVVLREEDYEFLMEQIKNDPMIKAQNFNNEQLKAFVKHIYNPENLAQLTSRSNLAIIQYRHFSFLFPEQNLDEAIKSIKKIRDEDRKPDNECIICYENINQNVVNSCLRCLDVMCKECASKNMGQQNIKIEEGSMFLIACCPKCREKLKLKF